MNKIRVIYFALVAILSAVSCKKEAAEPDVYDWAEGEIYFKTSLSDVATSRAEDMTLDHLESFQVTCFNTGDIKKDADGFVSPYFSDAKFIRMVTPYSGVAYVSSPDEDTYDWPTNNGVFTFFAFSPSCAAMASGNPAITDANRDYYFNLTNHSVETDSDVATDYRLGTMRVNRDISRQFDFVTAKASGDRWTDFTTGVDLAFRHQMSQVKLKAWGSSADYNFEIAGVRIGNPVVEGTFVFSDSASPYSAERWEIPEDAVKDKVEYLYRGSEVIGDKIYRISDTEHSAPESAGSLMGLGGCAMVIPTVNQKWEGRDDPNIGDIPYSTDKMYFSVLLRVSESSDGTQIYPYPGNRLNMTVVYYAVDDSGLILSRLYKGDEEGSFFTDRALTQPYGAAENEEIKEFGWAAVPVDVNWVAGKRYVYTLNYSEGIGVHDPEDPEPGTPIVGRGNISWGVSIGSWEYATKNEDFDPDVDVP